MRRFGLISALTLLLVTNGIVLGGVYYNRSAPADASVTLSERELPMTYNYSHIENSGISLKLNWNQSNWQWDWLDQAKLLELGFDQDILDTVKNRENYYRSLPVKAYVVLEFNGMAWQGFLHEQKTKIDRLPAQVANGKLLPEAAENQKKQFEASMRLASRLFAVNAGPDPQKLRDLYPDRQRYLILPAEIGATVHWETKAEDPERVLTLTGQINRILTDVIYVPQKYHALLIGLPNDERIYPGNYYYNLDDKRRVHYQARLMVGKRFEPWLADIIEVD